MNLRPGMPGDELLVRAWVGEPSGATWERFTEVLRVGEDRAIVTARTVWVLLDAVSKRPRRVDAGMVTQFIGGDLPAAECGRKQAFLSFALLASDSGMVRRQSISDDRLTAVTDHVRKWLFGRSS